MFNVYVINVYVINIYFITYNIEFIHIYINDNMITVYHIILIQINNILYYTLEENILYIDIYIICILLL